MSDAERLTAALRGKYRVEGELGAGGMATVYVAEDLKHQRRVAVKVLRHELAAAVGRERFLREIEVAAHLNHPNILPLFDSGEADEFLYYVMPEVEGESLRDRLDREQRLPLSDVLRMALDITAALDYAHRCGVVHRDLKPENILMHEGKAVLTDFGIAMVARLAVDDRVTGSGLVVGSPRYMSPEQASGEREIDGRSDLYSLGCLLYETLTGDVPFSGAFARFSEAPISLRKARDDVPPILDDIIRRLLQPRRDRRYASAAELLDALQHAQIILTSDRVATSTVLRRPLVAVPLLTLLLAVVGASAWLGRRETQLRWVRAVAIPEATTLIRSGRHYAAWHLLRDAERIAPDDPALRALLSESTLLVDVESTPSDAAVFVRDVLDDSGAWEPLGRTPLRDLRLPAATMVWRVGRDGFDTVDVLRWFRRRTVRFTLRSLESVPTGMVHVGSGTTNLPFLPESAHLDSFWIDRFEVTNRKYKEFVDAGGYKRLEESLGQLDASGRWISSTERRSLFKDRTGRHGPSTWELGSYPDGQAEYPVGGVSWYEAAAYCAAEDKQLPTLYHWSRAADFLTTAPFADYTTFHQDGPTPVGNPQSVSTYGTYDMSGNVKEWVWNEAASGSRYIMGGGWDEPSYQFHHPDARPATERSATHGFRCARYTSPVPPKLLHAVARTTRGVRRDPPVADEVFAHFRSFYAYDPLPLAARVDSSSEPNAYWKTEFVSFEAAYGGERVPAVLFLPTTVQPPYQTVVYFPGQGAFSARFPFGAAEGQREWFLFLVRSGRAVVLPIYKGSYHRYLGPATQPHVWRDLMLFGAKDLGRAIDYLETRGDIDTSRLAYYGISLGAGAAPIMTTIESRFRASMLVSGGLLLIAMPPEADPYHFLPRVTVPTLMINGKRDFFFPLEPSQTTMFQRLGTPHKKHALFESGHVPREWNEAVREMLDWLDTYLGPVDSRAVRR